MLQVRDIMTADVVTLAPELGLRDAIELFARRHISGAPVVANNSVVGLLSATDVLAFASNLPGAPRQQAESGSGDWEAPPDDPGEGAPSGAYFTELWDDAGAEVDVRFAESTRPEWNALEEHTVADAMTRAPLHAVPLSATVEDAASYMRLAGVHRLLVLEHGELRGIVTSMDLVRAVAEHRLTRRTFVFDEPS